MTPAPISVERLRELLDKATPGPWRSYRASKYWHLRNEAGEYVMEAGFRGLVRNQTDCALIAAMHEALPALLQQLAEREAEVESTLACNRGLVRLNEAVTARAESAERARDEACGLLRKAWRILDIDAPNDKTTDDIAAFLAASGGSHEPR